MQDRRRRAETLVRIQRERIPHLYVGGLDVESEANTTLLVTNPANGEPLGRCPAANARDVENAAATAKRTFEDSWSDTSPGERSRLLLSLSESIRHEAEDLAILEVLQTGKTFREVLGRDIKRASELLEHYAGRAGRIPGPAHDLGGGVLGVVHREPFDVYAAVLPVHSPFVSAVNKLGAAVALGSTLILQPPEQAPLTVLRLAELSREVGVPPGVINVLTGQGDGSGEALANCNLVSAMSFSGPIESARRMVLGAAKSNLKPMHLELGDKTPCIVFEDADKRRALDAICSSIFTSRCILPNAASRVLVHESQYEMFASTLTARAKEILLSDPLDEHTELGALPGKAHMERVLAYVSLGLQEGAKLVAGGRRATEGMKSAGCFVRPSVFVDVDPASRLATEDIGGPVLCVTPFRHEEEAIDIANRTIYGGAASIWTSDHARAQRAARQLQVGLTWVNGFDIFDPVIPCGGTKLSGYGASLGDEALVQMSRTKSLYLPSR